MGENKPIIEIKSINKSFGKKDILDNISLDIYPGERVAILGGNGAGKTTLVDMVSLTTKPTSGTIKINIEGNLKKEIGIQFQEGNWPSGISANDMLKFYKSIYPNFNDEREKYLEEIFEISSFKQSTLNRLSGGQKQRFNAMLAVLNNPKIVILDELTTGLDMKLQFKLIDFFKKSTIEEGQTLLIVSHMPEEVEQLCTRLIIIGDKKVLLDEKTENLFKKKISIRSLMHEYFERGVINV
ncbi:ABC transporter ATP-binding protein [Spiroplasma endosymbiont of Aspidapion aeneum]|uniref:ABC transporter ATP-binding protein n=1 Tax=Spiroplasma endosymbiont of Aspidapion aeneum TaxID=3066276 RepID=UPI00313E4B91